MQVRGTVPALYDNVDKQILAFLGKEAKEIPTIYTSIFKRQKSDKKFERYTSVAPFGDVPQKAEGAQYATDLIQQANTKDITPLEWGLAFVVTETAEEDDQFAVLAKKAKYLMFAMKQVEEKQAAAVLYGGFAASGSAGTVNTADGISLFNVAHTLKRGGTAKNRPSADADLSYTALAQGFIDLGTDTKLESGQLVQPPMNYNLVVPQASEFIAYPVIASAGLPGSADNDVNAVKARRKINLIVNPFLDAGDSDSWYLVPSDDSRHELIYLERLPITLKPPAEDVMTGNRVYRLRARKTWDAVDWRNVYGTQGA
jgi:hypothetical protein